MSRLIDPQYDAPAETHYEVSWSKYGKGVAELTVRWTIADPSISSLPDPKSLYFDFPLESPLRGGAVLLVSSQETLLFAAKKPAVEFIGGGFRDEAVYVVDPSALTKLTRGGPWRYLAVDGRGRLRAEGPLNLPGWEEMERRFAALKAELDKKASAPDSACEALPNNEEPI
jgi:hypothetical protein